MVSFITTTGVGVIREGIELSGANAQVGDAVLVSGSIGDHGMAIMSVRENLSFDAPIVSDTASLHGLIADLLTAVPGVHTLRDATRGGVAATLNEICQQSGVGMLIEEKTVARVAYRERSLRIARSGPAVRGQRGQDPSDLSGGSGRCCTGSHACSSTGRGGCADRYRGCRRPSIRADAYPFRGNADGGLDVGRTTAENLLMNTNLPSVLVVDDEVRSQESLRRTLEEDFIVFTAGSTEEARAIMEREFIQILLCDQRMPGTSGVEFLRDVRNRWPDTVRLILSGYTDAEDIISGINDAGIWQYLLKPWQPDQLLLTLKGAAELWRLQQDNQRLSLELRASPEALRRRVQEKRLKARNLAGFSQLARALQSPLNEVCTHAERLAGFDLPLLITGESGSGKELLARAIHYASTRADGPFVVENCAALPDQLLESELFGYKRGAFTGAYEDRMGLFQQANQGTIVLDEIGETSPAFQVKLLRVLQEGEVRPLGSTRPVTINVRVIAATNRDLEEEVRQGRFSSGSLLSVERGHTAVAGFARAPRGYPANCRNAAAAGAAATGQAGEGVYAGSARLHGALSLARQYPRVAE